MTKALSSTTKQLEQSYNWLLWSRSICRPYAATLGKSSDEMIDNAWRSIITEVQSISDTSWSWFNLTCTESYLT